jgi:membrane-bound serine protease (ClpP class)
MDFAHLVTTPFVSGLLLTIGLLGLLLEMQTLHGIAGFIALAALVLFFASHIAVGAGVFAAVLAVIGLGLILYELHIVPGHGLPGVLGSVALLASMVLAFGPWIGPATFVVAMQTVATAIVLTVLLFWIATRFFPQNAWIAKLTFAGAQGPEYVTSSDYSTLNGKSGVADSYLRPAGLAVIDGRRVDVLTRGEFIPQGTPVRVTHVEGARIFVEPIALPSYKE